MGRIHRDAVEARIAEALALIPTGVTVRDLSVRWGVETSAAKRFLCRHGLAEARKPRGRPRGSKAAKHKMYGNEPAWQNADPSSLTADQLDHALRLDITPRRYAWLMQCPKGGNAGGDKRNRSLR